LFPFSVSGRAGIGIWVREKVFPSDVCGTNSKALKMRDASVPNGKSDFSVDSSGMFIIVTSNTHEENIESSLRSGG
jgi:hypothetical protein